jgi:hypothetical protein
MRIMVQRTELRCMHKVLHKSLTPWRDSNSRSSDEILTLIQGGCSAIESVICGHDNIGAGSTYLCMKSKMQAICLAAKLTQYCLT